MIKQRFNEEIGAAFLRLFRAGNDTIQIALKLHILKYNQTPNEAKVCDLLHAARQAERLASK